MKKVKILKKKVKNILGILIPVFFVNFLVFALAWTNPAQSPPGGNPAFPLTPGVVEQIKDGMLSIGGIFEAVGLHLDPGVETQPTCDETTRGMMWLEKGGTGVASEFVFCRKKANDEYGWEVVE
jgi:hypothetical protein